MQPGVGGDVREMDELLTSMKVARYDANLKQRKQKKGAREIDSEKERFGRELMEMATQCHGSDDSDGARPPSDSISLPGRPCKAQKTNPAGLAFGEMERFALHLRDAGLARVEVDRNRLNFERDRLEFESSERERDRIERRRELEVSQKIELEKFNLMIEAFSKK